MNKKIPVYGMHCKSCELNIENEISKMNGVKFKSISQKDNYLEVEVDDEKSLNEVKDLIHNLGYKTTQTKVVKNTFLDIFIIFLLFVIFGVLYLLLKDIKLFDDLLKNNNLSYFVILIIGVVASLSTCLAITGGVVLGFSKYVDTSKTTYNHLKTQLNFHLGRILGFAFLGGILGSVGGYVGSIGLLNKFLLGLAGFFMLYMGLNMLGIIKYKLSLPKFFGNKILNIKNPVLAPIVGALTFFLPCGFTQSMQVYAVSSGSFLSGAMIMGIFALGTMPVLFLVGFGSSYFKDKNFDFLNKVIGVLVIYFAIFTLSGLANFFNFNTVNPKTTNTSTEVAQEELKEVTIKHDGSGFEDVILEGAKNYKLTIMPESDGLGCMFALTIPGLDENEYPVKAGIPIVIDIKNPKPGKYKAVCTAMGMRHGNIIIK